MALTHVMLKLKSCLQVEIRNTTQSPSTLLPQIDVFTENDYTYEEMKMTNETKKIMEDDSIAVSATCVRIPVLSAHSESVYIETKEVAPIDEVKAAIAEFPGAVLEDDVAHQVYPQAVNAVGSRDTFVGRIRKDLDAEKVSTCGLFQITSLKVPLGTQFKSQKHSTNVVWFAQHQN